MIILPHPNWRIDWNARMKDEVDFKGLKWFLPAFIGLVLSCSGPVKKDPRVLNRDEMVRVMMELYIMEEKVNRLALPRDSSQRFFDSAKTKILEKISFQDSTFRNSLKYYSERPKEMELIYTALVDSLQLRETKTAAPVQ